jgi:hypothetical protein
MAYSTALPPKLIAQNVGGGGALWAYASADVSTDVDASGYFTNGNALGMKVGDVVLVIETDNSYLQTTHSVTVSTAGGAATVSAAT